MNEDVTRGVIELAETYQDQFEFKTRNEDETYVAVKSDAEDHEQLKSLIEEAHGDFLPDDYRHRFVYDALIAIAECDPTDELDDAFQWIEPDVYTSDLVKWFGSNTQRIGYVNEVRDDYGCTNFDSVVDEIRAGQERERHEVYHTVLTTLRNHAEAQ